MARSDVLRTLVPQGVELVHPYGTRTIHRIDPNDKGATPRGAMTACGKYKVTLIDDIRLAGDYIPSQWDRWRNCAECFKD